MISRCNVRANDAEYQMAHIYKSMKEKIENAKLLAAQESVQLVRQDEAIQNIEVRQLKAFQDIEIPQFSPYLNYAEQYWKIYVQNEIQFCLIKESTEKTTQLQQIITEIEHLQDDYYRLTKMKNRKKNRRLAVEIEKIFICPYNNCRRVYGSDVSLNLHIKLKHNGGNKSDREKMAEEICQAEEKGLPMPPITINFPPGYLKEYRKLYFQNDDEVMREQLQDVKIEENSH